MGWCVWLVETSLALGAGFLLAAAFLRERGVLERAIATILVSVSLILVALQLCGFAGRLDRWTLGVVAPVLFAGASAVALRRVSLREAWQLLRQDCRAPLRLVREAWAERELGVAAVLPAAAALAVVIVMVWFFKSWTWDPVWYHVPITSYAIQNHSLARPDTHIPYVTSYAWNVEVLAVWNAIFPMDNRLDDSTQLPFFLLGALVVAAWARRLGASRAWAVALGAAWMTLPPVFLQAHSTHVDVAAGALFSAAVFFLSGPVSAVDRWLCLLSMGLYAGTKFTGLFHLALVAPWVAARGLLELRQAPGQRWRIFGSQLLSVAALVAVGASKYVQNAVHTGNPIHPFRTPVPLLGWELPGPLDQGALYAKPGHTDLTFFRLPGDLVRMLTNWFEAQPFYAPDVKTGGLGALFRWLLLPCVLIVAADVVRLRDWRRGLPVVALFGLALVVPYASWPRYIIAAGTAGLVALALVSQQLPGRWFRRGVAVALVGLSTYAFAKGFRGFIVFPKHFLASFRASPELRASLQIDTFLWPTEWGLRRERELAAGDVVTYDESTVFLQELFTRDYRTRVTFVSSRGEPEAYIQRLRALRARWVGVQRESAAARAVQQSGGELLFVAPASGLAMYRMHW
jgi:hypothetical protein